MKVKVFYNDGTIKRYVNVSMVFDNPYMKTYDIHFRSTLSDADLSNKMVAVPVSEIAVIQIKPDSNYIGGKNEY